MAITAKHAAYVCFVRPRSKRMLNLIALCFACFLFAPAVGAQGKPKEIILPLPNSAVRLKPTALKAAGVVDATGVDKTAEIARLVTNMFASSKPRQVSPVFSDRQRLALTQLEARTTSSVELKLHSLTGAVREIKGKVLHRAEGNDRNTAKAFLRINSELLKIKAPDDEFLLTSSQTDELGRRHLRFDQLYQGLPVWPAQAVVHLDTSGNVDLVNGIYVPTPSDSGNATTPVIDKDKAIALARSVAPGGNVGTLSKAELIFYVTDEGEAKLGWKIELSISLGSDWLVVIDAINGFTLTSYNKIMSGGVSGAGIDLSNVSRPLQVFQSGSTYYMVNTSKSMYDTTSAPPNLSKTNGAIVIDDAKHTPTDINVGYPDLYFVTSTAAGTGWMPDAVSAAYGLSEVYDYYLERHLRNSIDGNGATMHAVVRVSTGLNNAFWDNATQAMYFGDGGPYAKALDVVAHEMAHGVTASSANLEYKNQSGALNEAFSDIFGEAVEARTRGVNDWLMGSDLASPVRNMKDPHAINWARDCVTQKYMPYPAKMSEFVAPYDQRLSCYDLKGDNDGGWVHTNSSIINHAFYLLTAGQAGAIGMRDSERIFYRALLHLTPKSQFIDARLAAIASAEELFGKGSTQAQKTAQAFDAVEIYDNAPTPAPAPIPMVDGSDSTLFLFYDGKGWQLGRREAALGDSAVGDYVKKDKIAAYERVSVKGDGSLAAFVSSDNDLCTFYTDPDTVFAKDNTNLHCLGYPNTFSSAALSPSARTVALVLLDSNTGRPDNRITLIDITTGDSQTVTLKAATTNPKSINTILYADAMTFDFSKNRLYYDAVTEVPMSDGTNSYVWSIYALDIASGVTLNVLSPIPGIHAANPVLGHVHNDLMVFDAYDEASESSTIIVHNLTTNKLKVVAQTQKGYGFPSFAGDDSAIIFSQYDSAAASESSLWRQELADDHMTPSGTATLWLSDGDVATIYRRGSYTSGTTVVEFYHSGLNNYFITADPIEQAMVDSGAMGAWKRTGNTFKAGGSTPVCRFYGNLYGPNSHFYTADEDECANLVTIFNPIAKSWKLESYDFATTLPTDGSCPSELLPVYRSYNNGYARGIDSNHRITSNKTAYQQTIAAGWSGEGVIMCAPR